MTNNAHKKLTVEIELYTAAFLPDPRPEAARILRAMADTIERADLAPRPHNRRHLWYFHDAGNVTCAMLQCSTFKGLK